MTALAQAEALVSGLFPEEFWDVNDDVCDCVFQRIGMWTNPYLGETLEVRMCCIWAELYKLFPDKVRVTKGFLNYNTNQWEREPYEWNGEEDMPRSIWYRHMARKEGITVAEAREKYRGEAPPKGTPRPVAPPAPSQGDFLMDMFGSLAVQFSELMERLDGIENRLDSRGLAGIQPGASPDMDGAGANASRAVQTGDREVAP